MANNQPNNTATVQPQQPLPYHVSLETKNHTFIDMYYYLLNIGIPNFRADFMLRTYDLGLIGVDPFDPLLRSDIKMRIAIECGRNVWYFLRECVRIPRADGNVPYELHRGNMAMTYLFERNISQFNEQPRQFGKTIGAQCCYLWIFLFAARNSKILYYHKDHGGAKDNLKTLKELRDALPDYLQMKQEAIGSNGKKIKVPNTVETATNIVNNNTIVTLPSARSKEQADKIARGKTAPFIYFDEFAFMAYNEIVYSAAVPAFSTASEIAASVGAHYGIMITTTPGDLTTDEGNEAYTVRNNATQWVDEYYALSFNELDELHKANTKSSFFLVSYSYKQLGRGEEYFKRMVIELQNNWLKIRREVLLEWAEISDNCPFSKEDLERVKDFTREPIRKLFFGRNNRYVFNVYEDIDLRFPPIIGVDVSGALMNDSSAITIIDSVSTRVVADFNCNFIPADELADLIYTLVTKFMPNAIVNIEKNGGFGITVIQILAKTSIKKNLYFEWKDKTIEESFNGVHLTRKKQRVKVYGTDSTKQIRARMIELLYERVSFHKDKFISPILLHEMQTIVVDKHGKVQAIAPHHDDQIFSYLHAIRVWYDGENLAENFGIQKNTIKTDEDVEITDDIIDQEDGGKTTIEIQDTSDMENDEIKSQLNYIADASKYKLANEFNRASYEADQVSLKLMLDMNQPAKEAYMEKYHIDPTGMAGGIDFVELPTSLFGNVDPDDDYEYYNQQQKVLHGNLFDQFKDL